MEECRAESVALYLASNRDIAAIFGLTSQQDQDDLAYYTFVVMARAGVRALEWFDPATGRHGQAHMEARLGITNWMLDHGLGKVEYVEGKEGELVDAFVRLDRQAVLEKGKEVMGKLLVELQVRACLSLLCTNASNSLLMYLFVSLAGPEEYRRRRRRHRVLQEAHQASGRLGLQTAPPRTR